ncbi:MAG: helix-turn-helix transcriptional regulator [Clostridia bacterium]|nr:helix-turn-helix transcriptional regulator [Clostridia bacterium]
MLIQNVILSDESYTHDNWVYKDVFVGFSRLYYIIDGIAFYEEKGRKYLLKKGHIYLTPVKKAFTLYEDPQNKLLHTYAHIITTPAVNTFTEIEVRPDTPLYDAVILWRKYARSKDKVLIKNVLSFVLSCLEKECAQENIVAKQVKDHIDGQAELSLDMRALSTALGYSREHMTRSFLTAYGTTPKQYFNLQRMNAALEKLMAGCKIGQIAEELHYASLYSFSKAFKNHFGLSPANYLRTLKTEERNGLH